MPDVLRTVLERGLVLIAAQFGQLLLSEGPDLVVHYTTNVPPREVGLRFGLHHCVSGLAVQERRPVIVPDVTQADYLVVDLAPEGSGSSARLTPRSSGQPRYQRVLEREKDRIRAEFAIPMWSGSEIVGILNLETPRESGFSEAQRDDLAAFGRMEGGRFAEALSSGSEAGLAELRALLDEALARARIPPSASSCRSRGMSWSSCERPAASRQAPASRWSGRSAARR